MKTFTAEELALIIEKHGKWLRSENGGERANLSSANLSYADLSYADLRSANLSYADLSYADLRSANLSYADLSYANLSYADLSYANLSYADLSSAAGELTYIKSIFVEAYPIVYTVDYLQIGCERHLISEWQAFTDRTILEMDGKKALDFWNKFKAFIFMSIELSPALATGYVEKEEASK